MSVVSENVVFMGVVPSCKSSLPEVIYEKGIKKIRKFTRKQSLPVSL